MTFPIPLEVEPAPHSGVVRTARRKKVLVADSDRMSRALVGEILSMQYDVIETGDGLSAVKIARRVLPALVVCDAWLPGMDGFSVARAVKASHALAETPIVLVSARIGPHDISEALAAGACRYLMKPFVPTTFLDVVARLVDG